MYVGPSPINSPQFGYEPFSTAHVSHPKYLGGLGEGGASAPTSKFTQPKVPPLSMEEDCGEVEAGGGGEGGAAKSSQVGVGTLAGRDVGYGFGTQVYGGVGISTPEGALSTLPRSGSWGCMVSDASMCALAVMGSNNTPNGLLQEYVTLCVGGVWVVGVGGWWVYILFCVSV